MSLELRFPPLRNDSSEIERLASLAREIWTQHYTPVIGANQVDYMLRHFHGPEQISAQLAEGTLYFWLQVDGKEVGYMALDPVPDPAYLSKFYLLETLRGKGLARRGLDYLCSLVPGKDLQLTVHKHNVDSIAAYQALGFVIEKPIITDIGNGFVMDDYQMRKPASSRT